MSREAQEAGRTDGMVVGGASSMVDMREGAAGAVGVSARAMVNVGSTVSRVERQPWRACPYVRSKVDALQRSGIRRALRLLM